MVSQNGIIVNIDGMAGITDTLAHDLNGLYADSNRVLWIDSSGHYVPPGERFCPKCGEQQRGWEQNQREREEREKERERRINENKERERKNRK